MNTMNTSLRTRLASALVAGLGWACSSDISLEQPALDDDSAPLFPGGVAGAPPVASGDGGTGGTSSDASPPAAVAPPTGTSTTPVEANAEAPAPCSDVDSDGRCDDDDRCPVVAQAADADADGDGTPDACDPCGIGAALSLAPLFYFPLDEASTDSQVVNLGRVAQSAQYVGPVTRGLSGVADPNGRAVSLLGQQDAQFSSITMLGALEFPSTALTVSFWLRTTQTTTYSVVSYATADSLNELGIIFEGAVVRVTLNSSAFLSTGLDATVLADGGWHHVVFRWQETSGQLYFDGVAVGSPLATVPGAEEMGGRSIPVTGPLVLRPGGVLVLGQEQDSFNGGFDVAQALQGGLDEVAFYDRALNDEEIRTLFVATTCGERCDGVDNDSDGRTDEGFIGSGPQCAAESCSALVASGLAFGSGGYYLAQAPGVLTPCTF